MPWTNAASRSSARTPDPTRPRPVRTTRSAKFPFRYINVKADKAELERMIRLSGGRAVPVIVEGGKVTVGFGGT